MLALEDILTDNESGSATMLQKVQQWLLQETINKIPLPALFSSIDKIQLQFPYFGVLIHFIEELKSELEGSKNSGFDVQQWIEKYRLKWKNTQDIASMKMINKLAIDGKHLLVHSNSSAIGNLLGHIVANRLNVEVWQTYASPAGEGRAQAEVISEMGIDVKLIHEDAVANFMDHIDFAVFGADLILTNYYLNKIGTFSLSLLLREFNKPVYVLAESRKVWQDSIRLPLENEKPVAELYSGDHKNIKVINQYFEKIPLDLTDQVFMD